MNIERAIRFAVAAIFVAVPALHAAPATDLPATKESNLMKVRIDIDGTSVTASFDDNRTARDFVALLPLKLTLEDYGDKEKIGYLPRKLATDDAPDGTKPSTGDVTYYAPWGNLAIFHGDFRYSTGLVKLGRIDAGIDVFRRRGPVNVTISVAGD